MPPLSHPVRFLLVALAGWINQQQREVIEYLQAENRVLREQLGPRRLRFTDDQRIRLAYSWRIDRIGSILVAVCAGTKLASRATIISRTDTPRMV